MVTKAPRPEPEFTLGAVPSEHAGATGRRVPGSERTRWPTLAALAVVALIIGGAAFYAYRSRDTALPPQVAPAPPASAPAPLAQPAPGVQHPVEEIAGIAAMDPAAAPVPLPALDASDTVARDAIETILGDGAWVRLLVPAAVIRHIVATVDSLPRKTLAVRILPVKPVAGSLATESTAGKTSIAADNAGRYAAYIRAAEAIDAQRLAGFYVRLYPLFQQAYVELGYPNGYFNDRLINVIDHLLAAPEPKPPIYVTQPKVVFEYADPALEELSAGEKIMVRVGLGNELRLKSKLREIRSALSAKAASR